MINRVETVSFHKHKETATYEATNHNENKEHDNMCPYVRQSPDQLKVKCSKPTIED